MPVLSATRAVELDGLDDPRISDAEWDLLLAAGPTDVVFLTRAWMRAWWSVLGRGRLRVIAAVRDDRVVQLAPLFVEHGMAYLVASGGSDHLDLIGPPDGEATEAILGALREREPGLVGIKLYHVPVGSPTHDVLGALGAVGEEELPSPLLDLEADARAPRPSAQKKSLVRHDRALRRDGEVEIAHLRSGVLGLLDPFFDQHRERFRQFDDPAQRELFRALAREGSRAGWLRFTVVRWRGRPVAHHFGTAHRGRFLWYKPAFAVAEARRSPGEVLLRSLLLEAGEEGHHTFDLGLGDEPFKARFTSRVDHVRSLGLYA